MGAGISQRPSKCLKNRRTKSEECLSSKQNLTMGRFFHPWHTLINDNYLSVAPQQNRNATNPKIQPVATSPATVVTSVSPFVREFTREMEKSYNQIHRSNSLDKSSLQNDYDKLSPRNYCDDRMDDVDQLSFFNHKLGSRRLTIDVNKDTIFEVNLLKGSRGLGFSVLEYDGFIFIKQLFPLEAASQSGLLQEGDIILSANGNALTDLSAFEALRILRKSDNAVTLVMCRLRQFSNKKKPTISSSQTFCSDLTPLTYDCCLQYQEFEIEMQKINGSLGFTLRKDEDDHRNHVVRALVKRPAICDGRIKPGDQIISVNNRGIGDMSHQEAVKFLRDCGNLVTLRLRRDTLSSSLTSLSSSHIEDNNKTLRKEAVDMLNTLAVRKLKVNPYVRKDDGYSEREASSQHESRKRLQQKLPNDDRGGQEDGYSDQFSYEYSTFVERTTRDLHSAIDNNIADIADQPVSLPALDLGGDRTTFQHSDPTYHSINVPNLLSKNSNDNVDRIIATLSPEPASGENKGLLKWKGVVLDAAPSKCVVEGECEDTSLPPSPTIVVQLQRNWNSRLGFSLSHENGVSVISAIHTNSVAANDGRLQVGDQIIEVNSQDVRHLETGEVIKLLRTVRGTVAIRIARNAVDLKRL